MTIIYAGPVVDDTAMAARLRSVGDHAYTHAALVALVDAGVAREVAYRLVQQAARDGGTPLVTALRRRTAAEAPAIGPEALAGVGDLDAELRWMPVIFDRLKNRA